MLKASAVILAGGESRRIGGVKALIHLAGKPLITYVIEVAVKVFNDIVVVVGVDEQTKEFEGLLPHRVKVVRDLVRGEGPLVGILSGVGYVSSEYIAVLPCDSPFINPQVLSLLYERCQGSDAAIPRWPNGYLEPLHAFYKVQAVKSASTSAMKAGGCRVTDMVKRLNRVHYVDVKEVKRLDPDLLTFFNINRMEDLKRAERILLGASSTH
ncbi:MAG: molybdenum cofactor guanylyltransferase [Candidatus Bathyarchaeia archaeon]